MMKIPDDWFVCPIEKKTLKRDNNCLKTDNRKYYWLSKYKCWNFYPNEFVKNKKEWEIWGKIQNNGEISYTKDPKNNLGIGNRQDYIQFISFCNFRGNILDIGCGPQKKPSHMKYCKKKDIYFIGIDPLIGNGPHKFPFVRGLAEYLPFRDSLFDQVLFVTTLDHFVDPIKALKEAERVLKKNGEICIWFGEKSPTAPKPKVSHKWYEKLEIPDGAEDRFHFKRLNKNRIINIFEKVNLKILNEKKIVINEWRINYFYKLIK